MHMSEDEWKLVDIRNEYVVQYLEDVPDQSIELLCTYPPSCTEFHPNYWLPTTLEKLSPFGYAFIGVHPTPHELTAYFDLLKVAAPITILSVLAGPDFGDIPPASKQQYRCDWRAVLVIGSNCSRPLMHMGTSGETAMPSLDRQKFADTIVRHAAAPDYPVYDLFIEDWPFFVYAAVRLGLYVKACRC